MNMNADMKITVIVCLFYTEALEHSVKWLLNGDIQPFVDILLTYS